MERSKKIYIAAVTAVFAAALIFSVWRNFRSGVFVGNDFLYKQSDAMYIKNDANNIAADENGYTIILNGKRQTASVMWSKDRASVTFDDGTVMEGYWDGQNLWRDDGMPFTYSDGFSVSVGGEENHHIGKGTISDALCKIDRNETETRGSVWLVLVGVILYLMGAFAFLFPNESHFLLSSWAYKEPELSDAGLFMERLGGIAAMLAGIVFIIGIFIY